MLMRNKVIKIAELSLIVLLIALAIRFVNRVGIEQVRADVAQFGIWAPLIVLLLRLTGMAEFSCISFSHFPCKS